VSSGVVLTGGASMMPGIVELAEDIFFKPARIGVPQYNLRLADMIKNPRMSTAMGLLIDAQQQRARGSRIAQQVGATGSLYGRVKDWFAGNF
jgi:cell division protein FtsA